MHMRMHAHVLYHHSKKPYHRSLRFRLHVCKISAGGDQGRTLMRKAAKDCLSCARTSHAVLWCSFTRKLQDVPVNANGLASSNKPKKVPNLQLDSFPFLGR